MEQVHTTWVQSLPKQHCELKHIAIETHPNLKLQELFYNTDLPAFEVNVGLNILGKRLQLLQRAN